MIYEPLIVRALKQIQPNLLYILTDRNGVEPEDPYVIVSVFKPTKVGMSTRSTESKTGKELISTLYEVQVRLTLHAEATDDSQDLFETLHATLESSQASYALYNQGLGLQSVGEDILYVSQPVDTKIFRRAVFDINLFTTRLVEIDTPTIGRVEVDGIVYDEDNNEVPVHVEKEYP